MQDQTFQKPFSFVHIVTAAEETANAATIQVLPVPPDTRDFIFIGQILRDGVETTGFDYSYSKTTGILTIADAGAVSLTEGDVITIIGVFGFIE